MFVCFTTNAAKSFCNSTIPLHSCPDTNIMGKFDPRRGKNSDNSSRIICTLRAISARSTKSHFVSTICNFQLGFSIFFFSMTGVINGSPGRGTGEGESTVSSSVRQRTSVTLTPCRASNTSNTRFKAGPR